MTPGPDDDATREARALAADENARLCEGCVTCCTYVTVEVDKPRTPREYDQWLWAIMHQGVSLFVERPERWMLAIDSRCRNLEPDGRCAIHGRHPVLCLEYDPRCCERRLPLADIRAWFRTADELEDWLRRERPAHHQALVAWRATMRADATRHAPAPGALVTIAEPRADAALAGSGAGHGAR